MPQRLAFSFTFVEHLFMLPSLSARGAAPPNMGGYAHALPSATSIESFTSKVSVFLELVFFLPFLAIAQTEQLNAKLSRLLEIEYILGLSAMNTLIRIYVVGLLVID